jgi:hypothetical protein
MTLLAITVLWGAAGILALSGTGPAESRAAAAVDLAFAVLLGPFSFLLAGLARDMRGPEDC